ncbi:MAG: hypothetical protein NTX92_05575 [Euryarchaeota archaeon]|nr:hypothetical protein [Euryarchaeota archaeon]
MDTRLRIVGIIATVTCFLLMSSGCTEQNKTPTQETLQTILEKAAVLESVYYEIDTSFIQNGTLRQTMNMNIWQKMSYLKEEVNSTSENITITQIIIKRPDGLYHYDNVSQTYQLDPQTIIFQPSTTEMVYNLLNNQTLTINSISRITKEFQ